MKKMPDNRGQVLLIAAMIMALVSAYAAVVIEKSVHATKLNRAIDDNSQALWFAEAGAQKAVWCLNQTVGTNCGGTFGSGYVGESNINLGNGNFTTTVSGSSTSKTVTSVGILPSGETKVVKIKTSTAPQTVTQSGFDFAVQALGGGVYLSNNAQINDGPLYSNADVVCSNNGQTEKDVFVSKVGGKIDNCDNIRDAHADKVLNSQVNRDAYYKNNPADISGSSVGGTKYPNSPTPAPRNLPSFDLNFWRAAAEAGGTISGNYTPPSGSSIGPKKINGNLTITDSAGVTLTGPVWVSGNVLLTNNAVLKLSTAFGAASGLILADKQSDLAGSGKITISNNAVLERSAVDGSYILFVSTNTSTSDSSPAIDVANNVDGGVFYAPAGSVRINNNGNAMAAAGYRIYLNNNATINYDSAGLTPANMTVASTAAGTWRKVKGTRSE